MDRIITYSASETQERGSEFGQGLPPNSILSFFGDLGAGKTTFIQGIVAGVTGCPPTEVCSPTFVYLNIYEGPLLTVYHFDLYRLRDAEEFISMGFDEFFSAGGICCIEWAERIASLLPQNSYRATLTHVNEQQREICIRAPNL